MRTIALGCRESAARLNDTPWLTVIGYAYLSFLAVAVLRSALPAHWREPLKLLGFTLPLLLIVAKDLAQIPDVAARLRTLRRQKAGPLPLLAACLPPGLIGLARLERAIWRGFFGWLRREQPAARPDGTRLGFLDQGAYSTAIAIALFCVFVELPINALILPLFIKDPDTVRTIHLVMGLGSLYSLVWLLGDRWLVRGEGHVLTATHLDLQIGARASARIPLDAIRHAQALREPVAQWRKTHPCRPSEAVNITPFDKPNLVLELRPEGGSTIAHHGLARTGVRYVFLYLDRPAQLLAALAARPAAH